MSMDRTILLLDMNAFFASVEQQSNPMLRGKPVLVGGSHSHRSVVAAASYEARPYGIHSGMSVTEALRACPDAILVGGDSEKYSDASKRVFQICKDYTDLVEQYSIDECFMDVTGTEDRFGNAEDIARAIKRRIRDELGLTCSIGIAPNKVLAKLAANMQKPDGLVRIKREEVKDLLENLPVQELHGIGPRLGRRLSSMGINTAGILGRFPRQELKRIFGVMGEILHDIGNGVYFSPIVPYYRHPDAKSVGHSYTLERNTRNWSVVNSHLLRLSEMVGRRLRKYGSSGRTVMLVLRFADMRFYCRHNSLKEYIDDGMSIYRVALSMLQQEVARDKRPIRLVGVCVSNLVKAGRQLDVFADPRYMNLMQAMDSINDRFGEFTVMRASLVGLRTKVKIHGLGCKYLD